MKIVALPLSKPLLSALKHGLVPLTGGDQFARTEIGTVVGNPDSQATLFGVALVRPVVGYRGKTIPCGKDDWAVYVAFSNSQVPLV